MEELTIVNTLGGGVSLPVVFEELLIIQVCGRVRF